MGERGLKAEGRVEGDLEAGERFSEAGRDFWSFLPLPGRTRTFSTLFSTFSFSTFSTSSFFTFSVTFSFTFSFTIFTFSFSTLSTFSFSTFSPFSTTLGPMSQLWDLSVTSSFPGASQLYQIKDFHPAGKALSSSPHRVTDLKQQDYGLQVQVQAKGG